MASALTTATLAPPVPVKVHCHGTRPDGTPCRNKSPIAVVYPDGRVVAAHDGREHDVTGRSTTCPKCRTRRHFREGDTVIA